MSEYERAFIRATNTRNKSLFPDKAEWNPPGRILSSIERHLLLGPSNEVFYYNKLAVRDQNTNRLSYYSTKPADLKSAKMNSSFVSLGKGQESTSPKFGCILSLFSHSFIETTFWAVLEVFTQTTYDTDCNMWHVPVNTPVEKTVVMLQSQCLSSPLVVACSCDGGEQQLWFLNYNP